MASVFILIFSKNLNNRFPPIYMFTDKMVIHVVHLKGYHLLYKQNLQGFPNFLNIYF